MDNSLNLCCWNLRGLNNPLKQDALKRVMGKHNCSIRGFLETRLKQDGLNTVQKK